MRRVLPSLRSSLLALVAIGFLSACGQSPWGPQCVLPADVATGGGGYEYMATTEGWVNTGISVMKDDMLDGKAVGKMLLCPATGSATSIAVDSRNENWTPANLSVQQGDTLYLTIGEPNAADGPAGNKWTQINDGPEAWDPIKKIVGNDVCSATNLEPCWNIYGDNIRAGGRGLEVRFGGGQTRAVNEPNVRFNGNVALENVPAGNVELRVYDAPGSYGDNHGGFTVSVEKVSCKRKDGQNLSMRIVQAGQNVADATIQRPLSPAFSLYQVPVDGTIWLKLSDTNADGGDGIYNNNTGSYTVSFTSKIPDDSPKTTVVSKALNTVIVFLQETLQTTQRLFFTGLLGGDFGTALRAALVLYIIFYAIAFTFGMIQSPQIDFIKRLVKFAIVVQLLNPNMGWTFFNDHLFVVFNQGPAWLIHVFNNLETGTIPPFNPSDGINWTFLDKTVGQFISQSFWIKISSLIFSGPLGIVYFFGLVIGAVVFTKAVLHAILIYVMSLLTMTLLIAIAPLFIAFSLFKLTESLFESWLKTCVEYFLRPVFAFAVLTIFNFIMIALLMRILSFGACWKCILSFDLGISIVPKLCVLYFWQPEGYDSLSPLPGVYLPISLFELLTYLVVAFLTTTMIRFSEAQVSAIAGSTRGFSLSAKAKGLADDMKKPFSMDKASVKERKDAADKKKSRKGGSGGSDDSGSDGKGGSGSGGSGGSGTGGGAGGGGGGSGSGGSGGSGSGTGATGTGGSGAAPGNANNAKGSPPPLPPKPAHMRSAPIKPGAKPGQKKNDNKPGQGNDDNKPGMKTDVSGNGVKVVKGPEGVKPEAKVEVKRPTAFAIPKPGTSTSGGSGDAKQKPVVPPKPASLTNRSQSPATDNKGTGDGKPKSPPPVPPRPNKPRN